MPVIVVRTDIFEKHAYSGFQPLSMSHCLYSLQNAVNEERQTLSGNKNMCYFTVRMRNGLFVDVLYCTYLLETL